MAQRKMQKIKERIGHHMEPFFEAGLSFFGLALYRAWIALTIDQPFFDVPSALPAPQALFALSSTVVLLGCALANRRIGSLRSHRGAAVVAGVLFCCSTGVALYATVAAVAQLWLYQAAGIVGGCAVAYAILLWSELYCCLNPLRVAFYYSGSLALTEVVVFLLRGYNEQYLFGWMFVLPLISLASVFRSYRHIPAEDTPKSQGAGQRLPWKIIFLMAAFAFAFGCGTFDAPFDTAFSSPGALVVSLVVFVGTIGLVSRFDLSITYRGALSFLVFGCLLVPVVLPLDTALSQVFLSMSYASFSILIMLVLSNISYRLGISAILLFGVERTVRTMGLSAGRAFGSALTTLGLPNDMEHTAVMAVVGALVVLASILLFSERELSAKWGISFLGGGAVSSEAAERDRIDEACRTLSRRYALTNREQEVLLLLARGDSLQTVGEKLFVARGTIKAHAGHIYEKMGIHSRAELNALLGIRSD